MRLGVTGHGSEIAQAFINRYAGFNLGGSLEVGRDPSDLPLCCDDYILCAGVLYGKQVNDLLPAQLDETLHVNFTNIARFCDRLFEANDSARVVVIGSASGFRGSYDMAYAGAKAALHLYVKTKKLRTAKQHLVCVAPTIIENTGMTQRRTDLEETLERGKERRLGSWLQAEEVARIAHFALKERALCNTVIKANGGNW